MNVYQDITLLPDSETNLGFLWHKVYSQVHLALVTANRQEKHHALAFPMYGDKAFPMGNKLRVFAKTEQDMQLFDLNKWLQRLHDYCHISSVKLVPDNHGHVNYRRKQFKSNGLRLARRRALRKNESLEQALSHYGDFKDQKTRLPYVRLKSLSCGSVDGFNLYIEGSKAEQAVIGGFSCYGLSSAATVPDFE